MELETKKVSRFKSKKFWLKTVGVVFVLSMFYNIGNGSAKVELDREKVNYDQLVKTIKTKEKEVSAVEKKLDAIDKQYSDKKTEFDEAVKVVNNKKSVEDEIVKLDGTLKSKQGEVAKLDADIGTKQGELASVIGQIKEKKSAPIVLPAGQFVVGKDIPSGRYKSVPARGNGNFFVNGGEKSM
jgi:chromosome segregation ATPase